MKITIELDSLEELSKITDGVCIAPGVIKTETTPVTPTPVTPVTPTPTSTSTPVTPTPATPVASNVPAVQTSTPSYTADDLARAAVILMDAGRQADLQTLLAKYGVDSLPSLDKSQFGAFATDLRQMGAQI